MYDIIPNSIILECPMEVRENGARLTDGVAAI